MAAQICPILGCGFISNVGPQANAAICRSGKEDGNLVLFWVGEADGSGGHCNVEAALCTGMAMVRRRVCKWWQAEAEACVQVETGGGGGGCFGRWREWALDFPQKIIG